jgi:hypothetical protein
VWHNDAGVVDPSADLRRFDVFPFPLATAAHWTDSGFEIELVLITDVRDSGYEAMPLASHTVAYANGRQPEQGSAASAEFDHALREAFAVFAGKIARALRD